MKLVIIESPYAGNVELNVKYARACLKHSLSLGEAPLASHLLYTQPDVLDDNKAEERRQGINSGHAWIPKSDLMAVYTDFGITSGMLIGIEKARELKIPLVFRTIYNNEIK